MKSRPNQKLSHKSWVGIKSRRNFVKSRGKDRGNFFENVEVEVEENFIKKVEVEVEVEGKDRKKSRGKGRGRGKISERK